MFLCRLAISCMFESYFFVFPRKLKFAKNIDTGRCEFVELIALKCVSFRYVLKIFDCDFILLLL